MIRFGGRVHHAQHKSTCQQLESLEEEKSALEEFKSEKELELAEMNGLLERALKELEQNTEALYKAESERRTEAQFCRRLFTAPVF